MSWINRFSLTHKAIFISIFTGSVLWMVLDWQQSQRLTQVVNAELNARLERDSDAANSSFYISVEQHTNIARTFAQLEPVAHWLLQIQSNDGKIPENHDWSPPIKLWRGLLQPTSFILFGADKNIVSTHTVNDEYSVPKAIYAEPEYWLQRSIDRTLVADISDQPALIASAPVYYNDQLLLGYFSIYVRIDDLFLYHTLANHLSPQTTAVLLTGGFGTQRVWSSSNPSKVPIGTTAAELKKQHVYSGEGFFDQGDWGLQTQLAILIPTSVVDRLADSVSTLEHQQRLIASIAFVGMSLLLIIILSQRIQKIARKVRHFADAELGLDAITHHSKDAIRNLDTDFEVLAQKVVEARHALKATHEIEKKKGQLRILNAVTDELKVGVLANHNGSLQPINAPMRHYIDDIENIEIFTSHKSHIDIIDKQGCRRVFKLGSLHSDGEALILVNEVTELAEKNEQLQQLALHDPLTGLPNRTLLNERLEHTLQQAKRSQQPFALLLMDLNRFKDINDTLGHSTGDKILADVAYRLAKHIHSSDTLARLGGDEFALLIPEADKNKAKSIAAKLVDVQKQPHQVGEHVMDVGVSIGIITYPDGGDSANVLFSRADMAMYHAKRNQLGYSVYAESIDTGGVDQLTLSADLRSALRHNELEVWYQPQLNMRSHKLSGWEALVRWNHPKHGMVPPDVFIRLAEQTGSIRDITSFVMRQAIADCATWQKNGRQGGVSINLSTYDLAHSDLPNRFASLLTQNGLLGEAVTVEVTESALMSNPTQARFLLDQLNKLNLCISVDDFGTGYSSLGYLKELPVDEIKIDKSFVHDMVEDEQDQAIVQSVIGLAKSLRLKVVAEGIENIETLEHLHQYRCDIAQGFYLSRPIRFEHVLKFKLPEDLLQRSRYASEANVIDLKQH